MVNILLPPEERNLAPDQVENNRPQLRPGGTLITPADLGEAGQNLNRSSNVALLGMLAARLSIRRDFWMAAIEANLPAKSLAANIQAFQAGWTRAST